jgi:HEAT repeat protein
VLIAALKENNPDIKRDAAVALGQLHARESIQPLLALLQGETTEDLRGVAAYALGGMIDDRNIDIVKTMVKDKDPLVREAAANSLSRIKSKVGKKLAATLLGDKEERVRWAMVSVINELNQPNNYFTLLKQALKSEKSPWIKQQIEQILDRAELEENQPTIPKRPKVDLGIDPQVEQAHQEHLAASTRPLPTATALVKRKKKAAPTKKHRRKKRK